VQAFAREVGLRSNRAAHTDARGASQLLSHRSRAPVVRTLGVTACTQSPTRVIAMLDAVLEVNERERNRQVGAERSRLRRLVLSHSLPFDLSFPTRSAAWVRCTRGDRMVAFLVFLSTKPFGEVTTQAYSGVWFWCNEK